MENPSLREFNNNQSSWSSPAGMCTYSHTLTTVCEVYPHFSLCPRWRSAHPFCLEIQPDPAHFTRPSSRLPFLSLDAVRFSSKSTSSPPGHSHDPAHCIQPGPVKTRRAPDSLNPLVYFQSAPAPDLNPELLSPSSLGSLESTYSEEADT